MSADNMVYALPFQAEGAERVWRVLEVRLSGIEYELFEKMVASKDSEAFKEFAGPNSYTEALLAAHEWERKLDVCEYGVSAAAPDSLPMTLKILREQAEEAGYDMSSFK